VSGGLEEEIFVELDERRLAGLSMSIQDITSRLGQENINLTGGTLREGEAKYLVRTLNEFQTVEEINDVILTQRAGVPVRVSDIGVVYSGYRERSIITRINGEESVELAVFKVADANTVSVAELVRARLTELEQEYEGRRDPIQFEVVFDQSSFIQQSIEEVLSTAIYGGVLAVIVLFLFLRSLRTTLIIGLSIPISIVATFFLMYSFDISLNIMSLSGLALGIGMLVDNSIVVLESIFRYRSMGHSRRDSADLGASEVGSAVVASTMTTICVFVPIVFVEGIAGQLFSDQALTVTFSLVASLAVAILLIPMLSSLGGKSESGVEKEPRKVRTFILTKPYLWFLGLALKQRLIAVLVALALFVGSVQLVARLGSELIPEISQGEFFVDLQLPSGVPVEQTAVRMAELEEVISSDPRVNLFYTMAGTGNQTGVSAVEEREHIGQILVKLQPGMLHEQEAEAMETLRLGFLQIPGIEYKFSRPTLFSFKTPIEIIVEGYNLQSLKAYSERLRDELSQIPGLRDLKSSTEGGNPEVQIRFDRRKLANYGFTVNQVASLVRNKVLGDIPTEFNERDRRIDIRVRLKGEDRSSVRDLENLVINPGGNSPIILSTVGNVSLEEGPAEIRRLGPQRVGVITGNLVDRDLQSVVEDIKTVLADFPLPSDFTATVGGQSEERVVAFKSMQFAILLAIFLVYLVMASQFESMTQPFIIMFAIPFGLIGVSLTLFLANQVVNVVVLIGFIVLAGIVVNNAIVLLDLANQLRRKGEDKFEAIRNACSIRLRPILMTTSTTVLGLLPMALSHGEGSELRIPLAMTVIGGLIASTLLTLVFIPVVFTIVVREKSA
jgi:HAE1 family hydrophobic/amphiphilic exporter-1